VILTNGIANNRCYTKTIETLSASPYIWIEGDFNFWVSFWGLQTDTSFKFRV